jgi:hypothetical protein
MKMFSKLMLRLRSVWGIIQKLQRGKTQGSEISKVIEKL